WPRATHSVPRSIDTAEKASSPIIATATCTSTAPRSRRRPPGSGADRRTGGVLARGVRLTTGLGVMSFVRGGLRWPPRAAPPVSARAEAGRGGPRRGAGRGGGELGRAGGGG